MFLGNHTRIIYDFLVIIQESYDFCCVFMVVQGVFWASLLPTPIPRLGRAGSLLVASSSKHLISIIYTIIIS